VSRFDDFIPSTPAECGLGAAAVAALRDDLAGRGTDCLLVVRGDRVACEWYGEGYGPDVPHYTASMAKALVGGMSLAVALSDGLLSPDGLVSEFVPEWRGRGGASDDPLRSKITVRHLATHSSGIEDAEQGGRPHEELPGWKGAFWRREPDPFTIARDSAPVVFEPGTGYGYSNPGMAMLSWAVTAALPAAEQPDIRSLLRERVFGPIGLGDDDWSIGYGTTYTVDGLPLVANWGGGSFTARATARVGRLMMLGGEWNGAQLVAREWARAAVSFAGTPLPDREADPPAPASGLGWWVNSGCAWPGVPEDAFAGAGAGNQVLFVVPSLELVVVRNGTELLGEGFWGGLSERLFGPVVAAACSG